MANDFSDAALYPGLKPPSAYEKLAPNEKAFVDSYVATLSTSSAEAGAAVRINSPRARGLMQRPHVVAAINERRHTALAASQVDAVTVLREIKALATSNMGNYIHILDSGEPVVDLSGCTYEQLSAIQEITVEDYVDGRGDNARDVRKIKVKLYNKLDALEKLMRYLQLYQPERLDVNVKTQNVNLNVDMSAQDVADMYARTLNV